MPNDWRQKILSFFGNGTEAEVRRIEEEGIRRERERRRLARLALAHTKQRIAQEKREQAAYQDERRLRQELLKEAVAAEHDARRLKSGEIGLLEAMGIAVKDIE